MIKRAYEPLETHLQPNEVLVIYGPRRVGKTTLLQSYLAQTPLRYKLDSGGRHPHPAGAKLAGP